MCDGDVEEANDLVFQYMRDGKYTGLKWEYTAGKVYTDKVKLLQEKLNKKKYFGNNSYNDGYGNRLDIRHLCASIDALMYETSSALNFFSGLNEEQIDLCSTTVGDLASGIGNYYAYVQEGKRDCSFENMQKLYLEDINLKKTNPDYESKFPYMSSTDMLEDIDAYNIAHMLKNNSKLNFYNVFVQYYTGNVMTAKENYLEQRDETKWEDIIEETLENNLVRDLMIDGANGILGKKFDKSYFNKKITQNFKKDVAENFTKMINDIYRGVRK